MSVIEDYEAIYKIILIGDSGVGKSNILTRYIKDEFHMNTRSTVGVEFGTKIIKTSSIVVKAQIWDTAGQERYRALTTTYFKGSHGAFVVYDISKRKSFEGIDRWYEELKEYTDEDKTSIVFVGNKCDLKGEREVSVREGEGKAKALRVPFFETSALCNVMIDSAFRDLVEDIAVRNDRWQIKGKGRTKGENEGKEANRSNDFGVDGADSIQFELKQEEEVLNQRTHGCCF